MSQRTRKRERDALDNRRREYLGREFLKFWPTELDTPPFDPLEGVLPQVIAARCLGIEYGDPGPLLGGDICHDCWGDRHVWLGNAWGAQHRGGTKAGCTHRCHQGELWLASPGDVTQAQ